VQVVYTNDISIKMCSSGWRVSRDLGGEELGQAGTWVHERAARVIDSEGGRANGFCLHGRKGETERISGKTNHAMT